MPILKLIVGWIYKHFIFLLIIIALLVFGTAVRHQLEIIELTKEDIHILEEAEARMQGFFVSQRLGAIVRINRLKDHAESVLNARISKIDAEISNQKKEPMQTS